jgi:hypothetical protein
MSDLLQDLFPDAINTGLTVSTVAFGGPISFISGSTELGFTSGSNTAYFQTGGTIYQWAAQASGNWTLNITFVCKTSGDNGPIVFMMPASNSSGSLGYRYLNYGNLWYFQFADGSSTLNSPVFNTLTTGVSYTVQVVYTASTSTFDVYWDTGGINTHQNFSDATYTPVVFGCCGSPQNTSSTAVTGIHLSNVNVPSSSGSSPLPFIPWCEFLSSTL